MTLDRFPDELEEFVERVNVALHEEITSAKNVVARANAEKTALANALAELRDQHKQVQSQLDTVLKDLHRGSNLVGITREIAEARKTLEALKAETAEATKALAALSKERTECQAKVTALNGEVSQLGAVRAHNQEILAKIRSQFLGA